MATVQRTTLDDSVRGKRLARVVFRPQGPDPSTYPEVEVIFEIKKVDAIHLEGHPYAVIGPLSITRMDTRQTYGINDEQLDVVINAALEKAAEEDGLGSKF